MSGSIPEPKMEEKKEKEGGRGGKVRTATFS
jgi:hypothetical protein